MLLETKLKFEVESELKPSNQGRRVNLGVLHAKGKKQAGKPVVRGAGKLSFDVDEFCDSNYSRKNAATYMVPHSPHSVMKMLNSMGE